MPNVIAEAIKPCEDGEKAYIVRLYEAEGTRTNCEITFNGKGFAPTNMLEEELEKTQNSDTLQTTFAPFEIKTYKVYY
jgi:alpha-mannosidase